MDSLSFEQALSALEAPSVTPDQVASIIADGDATVNMISATKVKTAAAYKDLDIYKVTQASVILPISGDTYVNMVKESAAKLGSDQENIDNFERSDSYFTHTDVYPVCENKKDPSKKYLYCLYKDTSKPVYILDGKELTKEKVAECLTPSEAKKLLGEKVTVTENVSQGIKHDVTIRTISLDSVVSLTAI